MTFQDEIAAFFDRYVEAFAREDAAAISELWEPVGLFPSPDGNFSMDRPTFRSHSETLMDFYRKQGPTAWSPARTRLGSSASRSDELRRSK